MEQPLPSDYVARGAEPWRPRDARPPRALDLLVGGGALAMAAMAAVLAIVYKAWYQHQLADDTAILLCGFLFFVYAGGVYTFSYAWERGDVARAVRLTIVVVLLSAVAVLITALVLALLAKTKGGLSSPGGAPSRGTPITEGEGSAVDFGGLLRVAGSYVQDGGVRLGAAEVEEPSSELGLLIVPCEGCGTRFMPLPPRALCPQCGRAAVTVA